MSSNIPPNFNEDEVKEELQAQKEELTAALEELSRKNNRLDKALSDLEKRNFELDQIIYRTNHDLKSPMTSIQGISNLLRRELKDTNLYEYIDLIDVSLKNLKKYVKSMVDFAENFRGESEVVKINLGEFLDGIVEEISFIEGYNEVSILYEHPSFIYEGYEHRLRSIFLAIISNAIHYHDPKKKSILNIDFNLSENELSILFSDNGIGMDEDIKKRCSEMFYRGSESSVGSGLGLYITYRLVEQLNGYINIHSTINVGTTIQLVLPKFEL
ncbi:MAG: HAMP domain-containing sensor histidine kinase [Bacteroidota bacterium]